MTIDLTPAVRDAGFPEVESLRRAFRCQGIVGRKASQSFTSMARIQRRQAMPRVSGAEAFSAARFGAVVDNHNTVIGLPVVTKLCCERGLFSRFGAKRHFPVADSCSSARARDIAHGLKKTVIAQPICGPGLMVVQPILFASKWWSAVDNGSLLGQEHALWGSLESRKVGNATKSEEQRLRLTVEHLPNPIGPTIGAFVTLHRLEAGVRVCVVPLVGPIDFPGVSQIFAAFMPIYVHKLISHARRLGRNDLPVFFKLEARCIGIAAMQGVSGFCKIKAIVESFTGRHLPEFSHFLQQRFAPAWFRPVSDVAVPLSFAMSPSDETASNFRELRRVVSTKANYRLGIGIVTTLEKCTKAGTLQASGRPRRRDWDETLAVAGIVFYLVDKLRSRARK